MSPYQSKRPAGRDGFVQVVHGEWTKFRTVRSWVVGVAVAAVVMVVFAVLAGAGSVSRMQTPEHPEGILGHPEVPIGPGGEAVSDTFSFVHRSLDGDGSLTARVSALSGGAVSVSEGVPPTPGTPPRTTGTVHPWAKAGLIVKANTSPGSAYAAIMVTGGHGVRMQDNYTGDIAGPTGAAWLRLERAGDTVTGYASADGTRWTKVGTVHLAGLAPTVEAGMFVASPHAVTYDQQLGDGSTAGKTTAAIATFDALDQRGTWSSRPWTGTPIGPEGEGAPLDGFQPAGAGYTVYGTGDIAPSVGMAGTTVEHTLVGGFAALTVLVVLAALFITSEYRRGLMLTSLTASPRRGRVLAAKALVAGAVTFACGLVATAAAIPIGLHLLRGNGNFIYPIDAFTWLRVVAGTAALLGLAAVLAVAVGTVVRRSVAAVAGVIVLLVLPYILATAGVLPTGAAQWLLRVTPAAGFAIQQTVPAYSQVDYAYAPAIGFFPLAPWAGFAVLAAWTALALGIAAYRLRRRDA